MALGGVEDQWVRYWDESATIAKLEYEVEVSAQQPPPAKEKEKRRKKGPVPHCVVMHASDPCTSVADLASAAPAEASALPVSDKPVTLSFKGGSKPTVLTGLLLQHPSILRLKAFQVHPLPVQLLQHSDSLWRRKEIPMLMKETEPPPMKIPRVCLIRDMKSLLSGCVY
jgi:hypothetical protein